MIAKLLKRSMVYTMNVGTEIVKDIANWNFEGEIAENFIKHVTNSIVNYAEGHELICRLSHFFCKANSVCYDLGTSTGELLKKLALFNGNSPDIRWIGVDKVYEMIQKAKSFTEGISNIELINEDVLNIELEKSDFIVAYYTIQFIHPKFRQELLSKIYRSLNKGGAFIMFEKVICDDSNFQDIITSLYTEYKIKNNFTAEEIVNKTRSLYGVLRPYTTNDNIKQLKEVGFSNVSLIMKNLCFDGYIAVK